MKILLGVTGSISAYKTLDLTRELTKAGHIVRIVLTRGAERFVKKEVYGYLGAEETYCALDDFSAKQVLHVELAKWADRMIIVPLGANTLSRLAQGGAEDLLTSIFLAWPSAKPILVYPAMNSKMLEHPFVQENFNKLGSLPWVNIQSTLSGELACGDLGAGKLLPVEQILEEIQFFPELRVSHPRILITTGATISPLDPVRYLTNASTGKTGHFLAREFLKKGHPVTVIAGIHATDKLQNLLGIPGFELVRVTTTQNMADAVAKKFPDHEVYISAAAIGDIEFPTGSSKLKKESMSESLPIKKAKDVLAEVLKLRSPKQKIVGFAAETDLTEQMLREKWQRKPVDLLIGTKVNSGLTDQSRPIGFASDHASYRIMENGKITLEGDLSKQELAQKILERTTW